jgi:hypothetical protein
MVSERAFFGVSALLFAAQRGGDDRLVRVMSAMGEMPMPGYWKM